MTATYPVVLKHTFVGLSGKNKQQQPYTARAHSRYIQRESATHRVYTHLMPENYNARQRWFFDHENGLRKNARVIDKFTISIPHEVSQDHAEQVLAGFLKALGDERAPFMFTLQGFDSPNHHAHCIFIDKDFETGKRVFGTTEKDSTQDIKLVWEKAANTMFEELGYDVRIQVKNANDLRAENDNALRPQEPAGELPAGETESETPEATSTAPEGEHMERTTTSLVGVDPVETIKYLHSQATELHYLRHCKASLEEARERYEWLVSERANTSAEAGQYVQDTLPKLIHAQRAQERLAEHQTQDGNLKGRSFGIFGYTLFKTAARKEAEQAQIVAQEAKLEANQIEYAKLAYQTRIEVLDYHTTHAERVAQTRQSELIRLYGDEGDVENAEKTIRSGIEEAALVVSLGEAVTAFGEGLITEDEYRTFLTEGGYEAELKLMDEPQTHDEGYSL